MRALLTVTHHDGVRESYMLECPHGATNEQAEAASLEAREKRIASLLARHGTPYGCTCAAETDLLDTYPSVDSAIEQITSGSGQELAELDDELKAGLIRMIKDARCPECSIAVMVFPLHQPLVVAPLHNPRCPHASWSEATIESKDRPI
jgi:hypothetical protein